MPVCSACFLYYPMVGCDVCDDQCGTIPRYDHRTECHDIQHNICTCTFHGLLLTQGAYDITYTCTCTWSSKYTMYAVPCILFATLPNLFPPLHTPPSPPPTPARPLPECALPLPHVHLCTHPYFPNHNTTPFPHLPGLPRDGVQVHAGVLDCRPQEAAQLHPGGEDTGDPSGGKPLRWVSSVMINELPVGHIWA